VELGRHVGFRFQCLRACGFDSRGGYNGGNKVSRFERKQSEERMRPEAAFVFARLAQLVRAPRLHRGCRGFESLSEHLEGEK
jgi:hypothetical protein